MCDVFGRNNTKKKEEVLEETTKKRNKHHPPLDRDTQKKEYPVVVWVKITKTPNKIEFVTNESKPI